jgi:enoyl-CoA hydratase/carnithine racemase
MACDFVVMAQSAFLYQPFAAIGLVPDGGEDLCQEDIEYFFQRKIKPAQEPSITRA